MESKALGWKIEHPLSSSNRLYEVAVVLSDLAAQDNCDGEPYDQMQQASEYIRSLEAQLVSQNQAISELSQLLVQTQAILAALRPRLTAEEQEAVQKAIQSCRPARERLAKEQRR